MLLTDRAHVQPRLNITLIGILFKFTFITDPRCFRIYSVRVCVCALYIWTIESDSFEFSRVMTSNKFDANCQTKWNCSDRKKVSPEQCEFVEWHLRNSRHLKIDSLLSHSSTINRTARLSARSLFRNFSVAPHYLGQYRFRGRSSIFMLSPCAALKHTYGTTHSPLSPVYLRTQPRHPLTLFHLSGQHTLGIHTHTPSHHHTSLSHIERDQSVDRWTMQEMLQPIRQCIMLVLCFIAYLTRLTASIPLVVLIQLLDFLLVFELDLNFN